MYFVITYLTAVEVRGAKAHGVHVNIYLTCYRNITVHPKHHSACVCFSYASLNLIKNNQPVESDFLHVARSL